MFTATGVPLTEGSNSINVKAVDSAGNQGSASISVTLDTVSPQPFISSPADRLLTRNPQLTVSGTVSESDTVVTVNNIPAKVIGTDYTHTLTLEEGENRITVKATDRATNRGSAVVTVFLDSTPPGAPVLERLATPTNVPTVIVRGSAEAGSTVRLFAGSILVGSAKADASGLFAFPEIYLTEGENRFAARAMDAAGNEGAQSAPLTVVLDTKPPLVAITSPQPGLYLNSATVTVSGAIDDPTAQILVNGISATITGATFSAGNISLAEGANTITVTAVDPAGNRAETTITVNVDTKLPVVTVTTPLEGSFTNIPKVTINGTISEPDANVSVNGLAAAVNATDFTLANLSLAEGNNVLTVEAKDKANNKGTAIVTINLDTVNPQIFVTAPADGLLTKNPSQTIKGTVSEQLTSLTLNGKSLALNGLAFETSVTLSEGANSIALEATDRAGNKGTATVNVTLDSTPPVAPVLEQVTTPTNNPAVTIKGSAEAGSDVTLYLSGTQLATTTADAGGLFSFASIALAEGDNIFTAGATDKAGNPGQQSAPLLVTLDTVKPVVGITAPQQGTFLNTRTITVSGSIDDPTAAVTVNGLSALSSGGTWTLEGFVLQEGSNTLMVEARDLAGNKGSAAVTVTLDTILPVVTITAPVDGLYTNIKSQAVSGSINEAVSGVTVNGRAATINGTSFSLSDLQLDEGANTITVEAIDLAGNKGSATVTAILDTLAPQLTVIGPADGALLNNGQITFGGSAGEPVVSVLVNGTAAQAGTNGGYTLPVTLTEGSNTLNVTAIDRAGNSSTSTITVTLDSIAPLAPVLDQIASPTNKTTLAVSGRSEALATVKLFNSGQQVGTVKADASGLFTVPNITLTEGSNPFTATATDAAGNASPFSAPLTVVLDTKAPVITVTAPQQGIVVSDAQVTIKGTVDEPLASLTINGTSTPLSNLAFEYNLTLASGENNALIAATDLAGNSTSSTVVVQRDSTPPVVTITAPLSGLLTNNPQIQVIGTVDDPTATLTVGGAAVTLSNKAYSVGYLLSDGLNTIQAKGVDKAGNEGTAIVQVTLDAQPPMITLSAPATGTAGTDVAISVNATDNRGLTLVDVSADGASLWSVSPNGLLSAGQSVSLRLSPALPVGATVTVHVRALDAAGNAGSTTAVITIDKAADGSGWLQGKVLGDSRGLPLVGAQVNVTDAKGLQKSLNTTADGAWLFELPSGSARIEVVKNGFTTVSRDVTVRPGQRSSVLDSRLTRIDGTARLVDATGGTAKVVVEAGRSLDLAVPANALARQSDIRLTPISNQGLIASLPLGWSPVAALDLRLLDPIAGTAIEPQPLSAPATLTLPLPKGLGDAALTAQLARYDSTSRAWLATAEVTIAANATTATAQVNQPGQYALVVADPAPSNPPAPTPGQELTAASLQPSDFSLIITTGRVVPQAALPTVGLRAAGDLLLVAKPDAATAPALISGLVVNARVTEKFDLTSGDKLQPASTVQDIVLYRVPCATSIAGGTTEPPFDSAQGAGSVSGAELRTTFPVAPSKEFTIVDLLLGKISIEITPPDTSGGVMVGVDGTRLLQPDGTVLSIPAGALSGTAPVKVATLPNASLATLVGPDFHLLRGVDITISGQSLKSSATLSIPAPDGFNPSLPVVVAKKFDVKGGSKLKLVAMGKLSGSIITSETLTSELTNSADSINSTGQYLFLQATAPIGYVIGQITDSASAAFAGIQVSAQSATLADLTEVNGRYLLALVTGAQTVTALDPTRGDAASGSAAISANAKTTLNLVVLMTPPTVVSISPTNGATNVQPSVPVVVTFSKPMDKNTINSTTLKLTNSAGTEVPGVLTFNVDNKAVTFYPADALKQETTYSVAIAAETKDLQGYSLGQNVVSSFIVRRTTPPVMPPAGAISGTFPDSDGYITVTGTQGSAAADNTVLLINNSSGEIASIKPLTNGSFTVKVRGQLGDEIKVVLMDYSGNQTTISYLTFKSPDGSYLVSAKGGQIEGEGGSQLEIPEGSLVGAAVIKVTAVQESSLPSPVPGPGKFLSAFNIDTGGIGFQKEVHLSIPVPDGFDPKTPVFVTRPSEVYNADGTVEKVYEIIDSTKIINGRITTASPPFDGIIGIGSYMFTAFPEVTVGIVSGYTYQDMNDLPGYQEPYSRAAWDELKPGSTLDDPQYKYDRPVQGAVIRTPAAWNYVSYANAKGFYAGFTTLYANVGASDLEYKVTATHPLTMRRESVTGYLNDNQNLITNLNFKLADKNSIQPDKTAPVIEMALKEAPGQPSINRISSGVMPLDTELMLDPLAVTDQSAVDVFITVSSLSSGSPSSPVGSATPGLTSKTLVSAQTGDKPAIWRYSYQPAFSADLVGSQPFYFKPRTPGVYQITVDANDRATIPNKSSKSLQVRVVPKETIPGGVDGPPFIDYVTPKDGDADLLVSTVVSVWFSEPVDNVNDSTFQLIDITTGNPVPAVINATFEGGRMRADLIPRNNLAYDRSYRIKVTPGALPTGIKDTNPNPSANNGPLLLAKGYLGTFTTKRPSAYDLDTDDQFSGGHDIALFHNVNNGSDYAYVAAGDNGWRVIDVTYPDTPELVHTTSYTCAAGVADCTHVPPYNSYRGVAVHPDPNQAIMAMIENIAWGGSISDGGAQFGYIRFYDLAANPANPPIIAREKLAEAYSGIPIRVALWGDYAYVSTAAAALQVVSISAAKANFSQPSDGSSIVGVFDSIGQGYGSPGDIIVYGPGKALLATNPGYLLVLDINNPVPVLTGLLEPSKLGAFRVAGTTGYSYIDSNGNPQVMDLAVVGGNGKIKTVDLSNPYDPKTITTAKVKDAATGIDVDVASIAYDITINKAAGLAIVTTLSAIQVIDIKNPWNPRLINTFTKLPDTSGATTSTGTAAMIPIGTSPALVESNGWLYMADDTKGMRTLELGGEERRKIYCRDCDP